MSNSSHIVSRMGLRMPREPPRACGAARRRSGRSRHSQLCCQSGQSHVRVEEWAQHAGSCAIQAFGPRPASPAPPGGCAGGGGAWEGHGGGAAVEPDLRAPRAAQLAPPARRAAVYRGWRHRLQPARSHHHLMVVMMRAMSNGSTTDFNSSRRLIRHFLFVMTNCFHHEKSTKFALKGMELHELHHDLT